MRVVMFWLLMNLARVAEFVWLLVAVPAAVVEGALRRLADWSEVEWLCAVARGKSRGGR